MSSIKNILLFICNYNFYCYKCFGDNKGIVILYFKYMCSSWGLINNFRVYVFEVKCIDLIVFIDCNLNIKLLLVIYILKIERKLV